MTELISRKYVLQAMELLSEGKSQWVQWDIKGTNNLFHRNFSKL